LIEDNGGTVIVNDGVVSVSSENKLITGVKTKSGKQFTADYYISAIHPCTFVKLLEDKKILSKPYRERLEAIPNSYSAFTLFVKLKPGKVKYFNYTRYCMTRYDEIWNIGVADEQWPRGVMYMTTPEINQGEYSTKMIITTPMSWNLVKKWENTTVGHRGEDYKAWKQECAKKLLDRIDKIHPGFIDSIEAINTAYEALSDEDKAILTDAAKIFVMKGERVHIVEGEVFNIKITYPYDLRVAEALIQGNIE
jgi:all-trans-retinol 13,14-reductase